ncbi:histidine phosphatase family protein [Eubacteriaceae bacterium ES3]|nr:histidine phosphatase family protein [Eubacteriaceae bacterium ES3]
MKTKSYSLIILAAGYSSRMGQLKALLEIGGVKTITRLIRAAELAGLSETVVVTGYQAEVIEDAINTEKIKCIYNEGYKDGMFTSVKKGVQAINPKNMGFFILPVDYALVTGKLLSDMIEVFEAHPRPLVVPIFMGKKGHPPLLPMDLRQEILDSGAPGGLKAITQKHQARMIKTPTVFEGAVFDMDHPEDFYQALEIYKNKQIPDEKKCQAVLKENNTPDEVVEHSRAVAKLAYALAVVLNQVGEGLNENLLFAAGLLHDVARKQAKHDQKGAEILESYGWDRLAWLTANHLFYTKEDNNEPVTEQDVLCLADKCFIGHEFVDFAERKERVLSRFENDLEAVQAIEHRFAKAEELKKYIELKASRSLKEIYKEAKNPPRKEIDKKIILIRHGRPVQHQDKIFLGQTDIELDVQGRKDSLAAIEGLQHQSIKVIYSSPLKRTRQTAEIICRNLSERTGKRIEILEIPAFAEMSLGKWDGRLIQDIKKEFPRAYEERGKNRLSYKISGGENYYDLSYRVNKALFELLDNESQEPLIIVTHAGVMAVIRSFFEGLPLENTVKEKCGYGQVMMVKAKSDIQWPGW